MLNFIKSALREEEPRVFSPAEEAELSRIVENAVTIAIRKLQRQERKAYTL